MQGFCYTVYLYTMPLGFLLLENADRATIRGLWVSSTFRGYGVGSMMLEAAKADMLKSMLFVNANETAMEFYEKHGFEKIARREDFPNQYKMIYYDQQCNVSEASQGDILRRP